MLLHLWRETRFCFAVSTWQSRRCGSASETGGGFGGRRAEGPHGCCRCSVQDCFLVKFAKRWHASVKLGPVSGTLVLRLFWEQVE